MATKLLIGALLVGLALAVASCGQEKGPVTVSKAAIEQQARQTIADETRKDYEAVPRIYCPGGLAGKVGAKLNCTMNRDTSGRRFRVSLTVTEVKGDKVKFSLKTAPLYR